MVKYYIELRKGDAEYGLTHSFHDQVEANRFAKHNAKRLRGIVWHCLPLELAKEKGVTA